MPNPVEHGIRKPDSDFDKRANSDREEQPATYKKGKKGKKGKKPAKQTKAKQNQTGANNFNTPKGNAKW